MNLFIIVILVLLGVLLVVAEILILPGLSIAALGAAASFIAALTISYNTVGATFAGLVFLGAFTLTIIALAFSLRAKTLKKISLSHTIDSSVGDDISRDIPIGKEGVTTTRLAPMGSVEIDGKLYQGRSRSELIPPKSIVKVLSIEDNILIVEQIEN